MADKFDDQIRDLTNTSYELDKQLEQSRKLAALATQNAKKTEAINANLTSAGQASIQGSKVSNLDRVFRTFSALSTTNASYQASLQEKFLAQQKTFYKTYASDIVKELGSAATGREQRSTPKATGRDLAKLLDMPNSRAAGLALEIAGDPTSFVNVFKPVFSGITKIGMEATKQVASWSPKVSGVIDEVGRSFDLFYDIRKSMSSGKFKEFMQAYNFATATGDRTLLESFGKKAYSSQQAQQLTSQGYQNLSFNSKTFFPPELMNVLENVQDSVMKMAPQATGWQTTILKGVENTNRTLKEYVTAYFPAFYARNTFDSTLKNATMEGVGLKGYLKSWGTSILGGADNPLKTFASKFTIMDDVIEKAERYYTAALRGGIVNSGNMAGGTGLLNKVGNFLETNFAKMPYFVKQLEKTGSETTAAAKTFFTHYRYDDRYLTEFEKTIKKYFVPFYSFAKDDSKYWSNALLTKQTELSKLGKVRDFLMVEENRKDPNKRPDPLKDQTFALGNLGGFGLSFDDYVKRFTTGADGVTKWVSQVFTKSAEFLSGWNSFKKKEIERDTSGKAYANSWGPVKSAVGYNEPSGTVDPYKRWMLEAFGQRMWSFSTTDPFNKSILMNLTGLKQYEQTPQWIRDKNAATASAPGWMDVFINRLAGIISPEAQARVTAQTIQPVRIHGIQSSVMSEWEKKNPGKSYWGPLEVDSSEQGREKAYRNRKSYLIDSTKQGQTILSTDVFDNANRRWFNSYQLHDLMKNEPGVGAEGSNQLKWGDYYNWKATKPRTSDEEGYFSTGKLTNMRKTLGMDSMEIATNKAMEDLTSVMSGTTKLYKEGVSTIAGVREQMDAELKAWEMTKRTSTINFNDAAGRKIDEARKRAIRAQAQQQLDKLQEKIEVVQNQMFDNMADAEVEGMSRLQAKLQVELMKFESSKGGRLLKESDMSQYMQARNAIIASYNRKLQEQSAKDAKSIAESIGDTMKDTMTNTIEALQAIYERGGMSAKDFRDKTISAAMDKTKGSASNWIQAGIAELQETPGKKSTPVLTKSSQPEVGTIYTLPDHPELFAVWDGSKYSIRYPESVTIDEGFANTLSKVSQALPGKAIKGGVAPAWDASAYKTATEVFDPSGKMVSKQQEAINVLREIDSKLKTATDPTQARDLINKAGDVLRDAAKEGIGNVSRLSAVAKNTANESSAGDKIVTAAQEKYTKDMEALNKAMVEIRSNAEKINQEILQQQASLPTGLGLSSSLGLQWKEPMNGQALYDIGRQKFQSQLSQQRISGAQSLSSMGRGMSAVIPGMAQYQDGADPALYDQQLKEQIEFEKRRTDITVQGGQERMNALDLLEQRRLQNQQQINLLIENNDRTLAQQRLAITQSMASNLEQAASAIYDATGGQAKEMFYIMKAMSIANIIMKGQEAVVSAFASGSAVHPALGYAYAGTAAAFVAAQLAVAIAQTFGGTKKAEGGRITGGTGTKDDVPIMAMGGEYMIRKRAVQKYGEGFMEALNNGMVDIPDSIISEAGRPKVRAVKSAYASGGLVNVEPRKEKTEITMVNITDPSELDRYMATPSGQNAVLNVLSSRNLAARKIISGG